jgi:hypothetical protein
VALESTAEALQDALSRSWKQGPEGYIGKGCRYNGGAPRIDSSIGLLLVDVSGDGDAGAVALESAAEALQDALSRSWKQGPEGYIGKGYIYNGGAPRIDSSIGLLLVDVPGDGDAGAVALESAAEALQGALQIVEVGPHAPAQHVPREGREHPEGG